MENVKQMYEQTDLTLEQIAQKAEVSLWKVWKYVKDNYSQEHRKQRKVVNYAKSKNGELNPQFGKTGQDNFRFEGPVSDGKGYLMLIKPEWYTGRRGCKHVFVHHLVICEALKMTEIPKGFCVHHIDGDKTNNELNNLALLTTAAHMRLHQLERATTRAKARRA